MASKFRNTDHHGNIRGILADAQKAFDEGDWETLETMGVSLRYHARELKPKMLNVSYPDMRGKRIRSA